MERGKLLIVDDKEENLIALNAVLRDEGYDLVEASNGYEAIRQAKDFEFLAILLDVQMPQMNGFQAAENNCTSRPR